MTTETLSKEAVEAAAYFEHKLKFEIGPVELKTSHERGEKFQIIDLRTPELYGKGHVPSSLNVLYDNLEAYLPKLNKDVTTVVYCYDKLCYLSAKAALLLAQKGYKVRELAGGWDGWVEKGFQAEDKTSKGSCSSSCG